MSKIKESRKNLGPVYGVELIRDLPLGSGGMRQAMPSRQDLKQVREFNERTAAGYEILLQHYLAQRDMIEALTASIDRAVTNCAHIDDTCDRDEPGPLCGPTWAKVAHIFGLGSTSAVRLCEACNIDPEFDCSKDTNNHD